MTSPTPIKFGTDGWRAIIAQDFTFANLTRVTAATAGWLKEEAASLGPAAPSVMVGYDCRFNGKGFAEAVANQLAQAGIRVFISPGFVSTPMVSLATMQRQATAGIIITASHNPAEYSGFKLKGYFGGPLFPSKVAEVERRIPDEVAPIPDRYEELLASHQIEYYDMEALYVNHVKQAFDLDKIRKANIPLGYDAMYGAGQNVMRRHFPKAELLHCDYNPSFMGQAPEPIARNLGPFQALIREKNLTFGLATDGDADRIGLFDADANFVDSHHILLLLIHYLYSYKHLTGKVVTTFSTTSKIEVMCKACGLPHEITKIGFKYIGEIMVREPVLVGGEESGGIAVMGHAPERDGIYCGLMLLEMMALTGKSLRALIEEVYAVTGSFAVERIDLHVTEEIKQAILGKCKAGAYKTFGEYTVNRTEDMDGYKFHLGNDRWVMIRPSGTEPVLRVYAEAANTPAAEAILAVTEKVILGKQE